MTRYLLDTNHASALWRGDQEIAKRISGATGQYFGLPLPAVGELWYMAFNSQRVTANLSAVAAFISDFPLWDFDLPAAMEYGRLKTILRRQGLPIPDNDLQIAAIALANSLVVLTSDRRHFNRIPDLKCENWLHQPTGD